VGFFDSKCMISGVSLKGTDAAAVLLQKTADAYHPIALAIKGNYDRLGSIDGISEDANTRLVLKYFLDKLTSKEFVVDEPCWPSDRYPITDIEQLLWGFERNTNDYPKMAVLNGEPVVTALVCRAVWDAIADSTSSDDDAAEQFAELFEGVPVAQEIYRGKLSNVLQHLGELVAVSRFLKRRKIAWKPTAAGGQDYREEMREYLTTARKKFRGSKAVLAGLKDYESEVADLLRGDD